jgi:hypothetical protein
MAALVRKNSGALDELRRKIAEHPRTLKVGVLKGGTYPDGTSVPQVAAWNEFGIAKHGQPPRPFFRNMIAAQSPKWGKMASVILKSNDLDVDATLDTLGQEIAGRVRESINTLMEPPLAQSTIDRKGFDKPLIETSLMVKSVEHEVVEG